MKDEFSKTTFKVDRVKQEGLDVVQSQRDKAKEEVVALKADFKEFHDAFSGFQDLKDDTTTKLRVM